MHVTVSASYKILVEDREATERRRREQEEIDRRNREAIEQRRQAEQRAAGRAKSIELGTGLGTIGSFYMSSPATPLYPIMREEIRHLEFMVDTKDIAIRHEQHLNGYFITTPQALGLIEPNGRTLQTPVNIINHFEITEDEYHRLKHILDRCNRDEAYQKNIDLNAFKEGNIESHELWDTEELNGLTGIEL